MPAPTPPASTPSTAPSPGLTGAGEALMYRCAARIPPAIAHAQQQRLGRFTKGIAESMPSTTPPIKAGFILSFIYVYTLARIDPPRTVEAKATTLTPPVRNSSFILRPYAPGPGPPKPAGGGGGGGGGAPAPLPRTAAPISPPRAVQPMITTATTTTMNAPSPASIPAPIAEPPDCCTA